MIQNAIRNGLFDRLAVGLSGLCLAHCLGSALIFGLIASAGSMFDSHMVHKIGLVLAMVLAVIALGYGLMTHRSSLPAAFGIAGIAVMGWALVMPHGNMETLFTLAGVSILAVGHHLNIRAGR